MPNAVAEPPRLVLIVDDSADVREMFAVYLEHAGYETFEAVDGIDALEKVRGRNPYAILMDVAMPRMDGAEATRRLKADPTTASIPVIAVTGQGKQGMDSMRAARCDAVCLKPCFPEDLVAALAAVDRARS